MKLKLLPKFLLSLAVLSAVLMLGISFFSYQNSKSSLQELYADKVVNGSRTVARMLDLQDVREVLAAGGEDSEARQRLERLFEVIKQDNEVTFLSLVVPDEDSVTFYIDACVETMGDDPAAQIPYGTDILYTDAAYGEEDLQNYYVAWELYTQDTGTLTPLVTDNSYGYNYTGLWPIVDENGKAIAEIQYILDMQQVRNDLNRFLLTMVGISFGIILPSVICYAIFIRRNVLRPINRLVDFTDDITASGRFHGRQIALPTGDEIEKLANSYNFMLRELENYIENLSRVTAEKERIGAELSIAAHIQSSMLPCIFPAFPEREEFDIFASMNPAKEVGGDFYDFFMVDDRHLAIVMADVSGKGVPAALFMVIGKTLIKDHTLPDADLGDVFTRVNELLCESNSEGLFITAFEGVLDLVTGEFRFVNAGHEMPFLRCGDKDFEPYKIRPGFVLAGMENMRYRSGVITLAPGDCIFQYTDGVTEASNASMELYGMERLKRVLGNHRESTPREILRNIKADIDEFVGDAPQFDDITMLCLEYKKKMEVDL